MALTINFSAWSHVCTAWFTCHVTRHVFWRLYLNVNKSTLVLYSILCLLVEFLHLELLCDFCLVRSAWIKCFMSFAVLLFVLRSSTSYAWRCSFTSSVSLLCMWFAFECLKDFAFQLKSILFSSVSLCLHFRLSWLSGILQFLLYWIVFVL